MRALLALLLLCGCSAAPKTVVVQKITRVVRQQPAEPSPLEKAATAYVMRPDSDPQAIHEIRTRLKTVKTKKQKRALLNYIRRAPTTTQ